MLASFANIAAVPSVDAQPTTHLNSTQWLWVIIAFVVGFAVTRLKSKALTALGYIVMIGAVFIAIAASVGVGNAVDTIGRAFDGGGDGLVLFGGALKRAVSGTSSGPTMLFTGTLALILIFAAIVGYGLTRAKSKAITALGGIIIAGAVLIGIAATLGLGTTVNTFGDAFVGIGHGLNWFGNTLQRSA